MRRFILPIFYMIAGSGLTIIFFIIFIEPAERLGSGPTVTTHEVPRSSKWPTFRKHNIKDHCEWCGSKENLDLHHILPFHLFPEKELDPTNVVTLCQKDHFRVGHKGNWKDYDPDLKQKILDRNKKQ